MKHLTCRLQSKANACLLAKALAVCLLCLSCIIFGVDSYKLLECQQNGLTSWTIAILLHFRTTTFYLKYSIYRAANFSKNLGVIFCRGWPKFFLRDKLDVWHGMWKHAKAWVTRRNHESWQLCINIPSLCSDWRWRFSSAMDSLPEFLPRLSLFVTLLLSLTSGLLYSLG